MCNSILLGLRKLMSRRTHPVDCLELACTPGTVFHHDVKNSGCQWPGLDTYQYIIVYTLAFTGMLTVSR